MVLKTESKEKLLCILFVLWNLVDCKSGLELECLGNRIFVTISDLFLNANDINVINPNQIYFKNNPNCAASRLNESYTLEILPPFDTCGTSLQHETESYVYSNEIIIKRSDEEDEETEDNIDRIPIQCIYDDKYIVSSDYGLKPYVRTVYFETAKGNISMEMNLYQRDDYHPKSRLGPNPMVLVSIPLYVSVKMEDIFGDSKISTVLENCYATDEPSYKDMDSLLHYLVQGRCVSPDDSTVRIYKNGISYDARFKFDMFRWKQGQTEFVYLHCEVKVCNRSKEECTGAGDQCNGVRSERTKRNLEDVESGITSIGPIAIGQVDREGKAKLETGLKRMKNDKDFLTIYIILAVGIVLTFFVLIFVFAISVKRSRQIKEFKKQCEKMVAYGTPKSTFNHNSLPRC